MPIIKYKEHRFTARSEALIGFCNAIIEEYREMGYDLTLRQLYYKLVTKEVIPNKDTEYKKLGSLISNARLAGLIDWDSITDRTRNLRARSHWDGLAGIIETCAHQYHMDMWGNQNYYVECFVEKDALIGILEGVCSKWDVPFSSCRGYTSQSAMWRASQRLAEAMASTNRQAVLIHLSDHDPSGINMGEDITKRLGMFEASRVDYRRIALTMDQVQAGGYPPNPAKETDSRAPRYIARFGHSSWELDAMPPNELSTLIESHITALIDQDRWDEKLEEEKAGRRILAK